MRWPSNWATPAHLLDPYHPLLHPFGLAFYRLWQALGWTGQSLLPLQVLNALAGAFCAGLVTDIARRLTGSARLALLTGLGFAVSGGLWMLSVEAEFVTLPLAAALLVLWALLAASPRRAGTAGYAVLLALATAVAFWSYASGAILFLVVLTGILLDSRLGPPVRRRQALIYSGALLVVVIPATLIFLAQWSQGDWARVPAYFLSRGEYSRFALSDLPHGVYGFLRSLALYPRLSLIGTTRQFLDQASPAERGLFVAYYGLALLVAARRWRWQCVIGGAWQPVSATADRSCRLVSSLCGLRHLLGAGRCLVLAATAGRLVVAAGAGDIGRDRRRPVAKRPSLADRAGGRGCHAGRS